MLVSRMSLEDKIKILCKRGWLIVESPTPLLTKMNHVNHPTAIYIAEAWIIYESWLCR